MEFTKEMKIFEACKEIFPGSDSANTLVGSILLARQLDPYISSSLDIGWITRYILEIGTHGLYSKCRGAELQVADIQNPSFVPEYRHATMIVKLYKLCSLAYSNETLSYEEASNALFSEEEEFDYGELLTRFNHLLIHHLCPEIDMLVAQ